MIAPRDKLWSTPLEVISIATELLQLESHDIVYDIGAGDGRFIFHCAKTTSACKIIGVELNKERVDDIMQGIAEESLVERCRIIHGNALEQDYSEATAIFLYLIPRGLRIILPLLKQIPHKVRVVSYLSPFPESEMPKEVIKVKSVKHEGAAWPVYLYELNA